ncbi:MAG TPA: cob(I)yrinic acid a,c-diamide adenosyltransferase [Candidatus Onthocola gallistercoris]|uniref:Cob(I)yrinic acid a,c-diamide adenosyltransferase n=1 Tax=Candidatus Onthocola gallistercoris TaxID=2840876 RepID=A0A9D1HG75_9FIRM|nr:cob(I)yrinic acid a,c-diamide adenosyltransferase [Candidatus Onthocola gallistercoris]
MIHIYHGDGKGKTTCGMGLCLRAAGAGKRVLIYQFMKNNHSSERNVLKQVAGITLMDGPDQVKFTSRMTDDERRAFGVYCQETLARIRERILLENSEVVFLDEILYAIDRQMISERMLLDLIWTLPDSIEWILTGRHPGKRLCERADYISEIRKEKHPFDRGIQARRGIEY